MTINTLAKLLKAQPTQADIEDLLEGLLTPKELEEIEKRVKIIQMMKAGVPHLEIAQKLNVGITTVSRGSRQLQRGSFSQIKPNKDAWR